MNYTRPTKSGAMYLLCCRTRRSRRRVRTAAPSQKLPLGRRRNRKSIWTGHLIGPAGFLAAMTGSDSEASRPPDSRHLKLPPSSMGTRIHSGGRESKRQEPDTKRPARPANSVRPQFLAVFGQRGGQARPPTSAVHSSRIARAPLVAGFIASS